MTEQDFHHCHYRGYLRHPSEMPIRIVCGQGAACPLGAGGTPHLTNVSLGGLACEADTPLVPGSEVTVEIVVAGEAFRARGAVRWCRPHAQVFELGIEFMAREDAYAARMVEQLCYIERYRREVHEREGREIDSSTAALEWIRLHAASFPPLR
ncbi:MAG: PilZ domain-containing protein [Candidatus Dactylopiibacterium sp.]|nr:PilZ domain-containing protein [Candidatus Dactylopiibacterium sp.]